MFPLRSLTLRGRCLLAGGGAAAITGLALAQRDVLRVAVLLIVAPLIAAATIGRSRFSLSCVRTLDRPRVAAGDRARVTLRLENLSRLPTGLLLVEDTVPYQLGGRPRVTVNRLAPRRPVNVGYELTAATRGRYQLGPLSIRLLDPFGLCELPRSFSAVDTLVVTPAVVPLPPVRLTGEWAGAGESSSRSVATSGEDDAATREYRHGDDLRRIHWRSTARRGELTVRREEQPWQSRGAIMLDCRSLAHAGEGAASSFEWAVTAAASVGVHLSRSGFGMRLVTDTGAEVSGGGLAGAAFEAELLDSLAVVRPSVNRSLSLGIGGLRRNGGEGLLVAVLGAVSVEDAEQLARLRSHRSVGVALLADTDSWEFPDDDAGPGGSIRDVQAVLAGAGWRTVSARRHQPLAEVWRAVGQTVTSLAPDDAVAPTGAATT